MRSLKRIAVIALMARILMAGTTLAFLVASCVVLYQAGTGNMAGIDQVLGQNLKGPLHPWQLAVAALLLLISVAPILFAFWSAHRFFQHFARAEIFAGAMEGTVRSLGWSLVLFWFFDWLTNAAALPLVTFYEPTGRQLALGFTIDERVIMPIVGTILVLIAQALGAARKIDEDSKLIV